jgi:hypothetical protein
MFVFGRAGAFIEKLETTRFWSRGFRLQKKYRRKHRKAVEDFHNEKRVVPETEVKLAIKVEGGPTAANIPRIYFLCLHLEPNPVATVVHRRSVLM